MAATDRLFSLVYVSSTVVPFTKSELAALLAKCHRNNDAAGITGMLLYKDGNVMQALEGEERAVRTLFDKIGRDPRHRGLLVIYQGPLLARQFQDWSMGFRDLTGGESHATPGYSEFLNTPLTGREFSSDPTRSQKLLTTFKKSM